MQKIRKIVIPAAGLGSRFYPLTKAQPKEMLPIIDKPVIHYVVEEAIKAGINQILIIVGKGKEALINYFDSHELDSLDTEGKNRFPEIFFVRQKKPVGLGDAIRYAQKFVGNEPFLVLLGDTIYQSSSDMNVAQQLLSAFEKTGSPIIALEKVKKEKTKDYGIISGENLGGRLWLIKKLVEKPEPKDAPSDLAITGAYILPPEIFGYLEKIKPGKNNEYQLTDALELLARENKLLGYEFDGTRYDIGTKELWIRAFIEFIDKDPRFEKILLETIEKHNKH